MEIDLFDGIFAILILVATLGELAGVGWLMDSRRRLDECLDANFDRWLENAVKTKDEGGNLTLSMEIPENEFPDLFECTLADITFWGSFICLLMLVAIAYPTSLLWGSLLAGLVAMATLTFERCGKPTSPTERQDQ